MFLRRVANAAIFGIINFIYLPQFIRCSILNMNMNNSLIISKLIRRLGGAEKKLENVLVEIKEIKRELSTVLRAQGEKDLTKEVKRELPTVMCAKGEKNLDKLLLHAPAFANNVPAKRFKSSLSENEDDIDLGDLVDSSMDFQRADGYVIVYTDGACENNGKVIAKAGIGVWWGHNHFLNDSSPVEGRATNNTAEIQACVKAIDIALENGIRKLIIKTDSEFVINSITKWIKRWRTNNWKSASGSDVKNKEDFQKLDAACKKLDDIKWEHVRGHVGVEGNEQADKLARGGAVRYKSK